LAYGSTDQYELQTVALNPGIDYEVTLSVINFVGEVSTISSHFLYSEKQIPIVTSSVGTNFEI
jgi:hypothetical protein